MGFALLHRNDYLCLTTVLRDTPDPVDTLPEVDVAVICPARPVSPRRRWPQRHRRTAGDRNALHLPVASPKADLLTIGGKERTSGLLRAADGCGYQIVNRSEPELPVGAEYHRAAIR